MVAAANMPDESSAINLILAAELVIGLGLLFSSFLTSRESSWAAVWSPMAWIAGVVSPSRWGLSTRSAVRAETLCGSGGLLRIEPEVFDRRLSLRGLLSSHLPLDVVCDYSAWGERSTLRRSCRLRSCARVEWAAPSGGATVFSDGIVSVSVQVKPFPGLASADTQADTQALVATVTLRNVAPQTSGPTTIVVHEVRFELQLGGDSSFASLSKVKMLRNGFGTFTKTAVVPASYCQEGGVTNQTYWCVPFLGMAAVAQYHGAHYGWTVAALLSALFFAWLCPFLSRGLSGIANNVDSRFFSGFVPGERRVAKPAAAYLVSLLARPGSLSARLPCSLLLSPAASQSRNS